MEPTSDGPQAVSFTSLGSAPARPRIALLEADPGFSEAIPAGEMRLAEAALRVPAFELEQGPWHPPLGDDDAAGTVVLDGLLSRTMALGGRASLELYGPGDLILEDDPADADAQVTWFVHTRSRLAVLDGRFLRSAQRWPGLWRVVLRRTAQRSERLASHLAALQLSRVEDRIETVLWQLADRWGRVTPDGVVVPLPLTHGMLGQLVAAKRPTVSLALTAMAEEGVVHRLPDGGWRLVPRVTETGVWTSASAR